MCQQAKALASKLPKTLVETVQRHPYFHVRQLSQATKSSNLNRSIPPGDRASTAPMAVSSWIFRQRTCRSPANVLLEFERLSQSSNANPKDYKFNRDELHERRRAASPFSTPTSSCPPTTPARRKNKPKHSASSRNTSGPVWRCCPFRSSRNTSLPPPSTAKTSKPVAIGPDCGSSTPSTPNSRADQSPVTDFFRSISCVLNSLFKRPPNGPKSPRRSRCFNPPIFQSQVFQ